MKTRDILTLIGVSLLAVGPVLMHHVDSTAIYLAGELCTVLGPVLMGARALLSDGNTPTPPK